MPRIARIKGEFQTYHIIQRGNEKKDIFRTINDRIKFLDILLCMKQKYNFIIEAYCLMSNHVHLLINDNGNDISKIVKSMNISYAYYFNHMYNRIGHLFQDRFRSELVDNERYLLAVSAYIHNNPVKAGLVASPEDYPWSSFSHYMRNGDDETGLIYCDRILNAFSCSRTRAEKEYYAFVRKFVPESGIMDVDDDMVLCLKDSIEYLDSYAAAEKMVQNMLTVKRMSIGELKKDKDFRQELVLKLRGNSNLTLREIGQLAGGISESMTCKILNSR